MLIIIFSLLPTVTLKILTKGALLKVDVVVGTKRNVRSPIRTQQDAIPFFWVVAPKIWVWHPSAARKHVTGADFIRNHHSRLVFEMITVDTIIPRSNSVIGIRLILFLFFFLTDL